MTADVGPDGAFDIELPVHELGDGVYDIGVTADRAFVADGRFRVGRTGPAGHR